MNRVVGVDHLSICVSNFKKSKAFYSKLFVFLGFKILDEYEDAMGWTNGKTRFWINAVAAKNKKRKYRFGDVGFHHYAFELRNRKDVDELYSLVRKLGATIVDPPDEYYENYYSVFFLDPDGMKLEGMKYSKVKQNKK